MFTFGFEFLSEKNSLSTLPLIMWFQALRLCTTEQSGHKKNNQRPYLSDIPCAVEKSQFPFYLPYNPAGHWSYWCRENIRGT